MGGGIRTTSKGQWLLVHFAKSSLERVSVVGYEFSWMEYPQNWSVDSPCECPKDVPHVSLVSRLCKGLSLPIFDQTMVRVPWRKGTSLQGHGDKPAVKNRCLLISSHRLSENHLETGNSDRKTITPAHTTFSHICRWSVGCTVKTAAQSSAIKATPPTVQIDPNQRD